MKTLSIFSPTIDKAKDLAKQIKMQNKELAYEIKEYAATESSQFEFLVAVHNDDAVIIDCTIPDDLNQPTTYPILTAQVNSLDHILIYSDSYYDDKDYKGDYVPILPLNITPQREYRSKDKDVVKWLIEQLSDLQTHDYYPRLHLTDLESLTQYKSEMEQMLLSSMSLHNSQKGEKTRVMISYRNSCSAEVEQFRKEIEAQGKVEIKVLPPGSLCGDYEAHTPMRRWMLAGLLDDHIREVDEVWIYYNDIYANSWWTLAELVMAANINYDCIEENKIKIKVYDAKTKRFLNDNDFPLFARVTLTTDQHRRLARLLSNTRPDTMGPESLENINQLKQIVSIMRGMPEILRNKFAEQMRPVLEQGIPQSISKEQQEEIIHDLIKMYSDPDELERYVNDEVFQDIFWNNISYQTELKTPALVDNVINSDIFMDTPMNEDTGLGEKDLEFAVQNKTPVVLGSKHYRVEKGLKRYLWLATRMGQPTVKDAPGLEMIQTYNLIADEKSIS